jgi:glycosyltransferase involved in cell wall biosynthesis
MKIGIMIDYIAPGSAPKAIGQEVKGLKKLGHDVSSLVIKGGYSEHYQFHLKDVPIRVMTDEFPNIAKKIDRKIPGFSFFSVHHLSTPFFAPSIINEKEYDVLVVHSTYTCFTARRLKKKRNIPYIPFIWDPMSYILPHVYSNSSIKKLMPLLSPMARWADSFILKDCQAVITSGRMHHQLLHSLTDKKLEILYPGCFPVSMVNEERQNFMLAFDRWDIGNTPHILLDILEKIDGDLDLVVGGHWYPESIKTSFISEVSRRNLSARVKIIGALDEKQIIELCSKALLHIHTNKEVFGMQSLEAAACGCPIIVPKGSGVTELFEHGKDGLFPEEHDLEEHVEYINKLLSDRSFAVKMGKSAWGKAKNQTWDKHASDLLGIIERNM